MNARLNPNEVGASAYDLRVMLKVVLLAHSQTSLALKLRVQPTRTNHTRCR